MPLDNSNLRYEQIRESTQQTIENGPDSSYQIYGYNRKNKYISYHIFCIFLLGIPYMIFSWYPKYKTIFYRKSPLKEASFILLCENSIIYSLIDISIDVVEIPSKGVTTLKYFIYQKTKYVLIEDHFDVLYKLFPEITFADIIYKSPGLLQAEEKTLLKLYGYNKIAVEVKSYWRLFIEEVFNPYYLFQLFSIILWCTDHYVIYAVCILVLTLFSAISGLLETRRQSQALHDLVEKSAVTNVQIQREPGQNIYEVDSEELVPGDIIVIPKGGLIMPCDAVLVQGSCIVNESMLTGESVPVTKTVPHESDEIYSSMTHKRYTLFCGTHVIQTRYFAGENVLARVVKTGFETTKGSLVKSIMFSSTVGLKFYKESMKFVLVLLIIAGMGMGYSLYLYISRDAAISDIIIRTLDIVTIVVPPALPAAITVAIVSSQNRLKKLGIFCVSPPRINVSGRINLACFDKTGTLTQDGLDFFCIHPCKNNHFIEAIPDPQLLDKHSHLVQAMATCHSLTRINGELCGDPLDLNMFDSINWELEEPSSTENTNYDPLISAIVKPRDYYYYNVAGGGDTQNLYEIGILKVFHFCSEFQCMSVICRILNQEGMMVYTKGAPEKIVKLCQPRTVPEDFCTQLAQYTATGKRVIAVGYKELPPTVTWPESQKIQRDKVESDLIFLGLIVLQNTLKFETTPVLSLLREANIRTVMITGDNVETAVCVARNSNMVLVNEKIMLIQVEMDAHNSPILSCQNLELNTDKRNIISFDNEHYHYAMDGRTWSKLCTYYEEIIPIILSRATVFARFQPDQKAQVVKHFQNLDYIVCMVGDGANDCGALKAAHVGISLSPTEASVAAPFTSRIDNISCVIRLILEGRCALVTSFAEIRYMAMYSAIQFFSVLLLYKHYSILGDVQFLYIDLIITTTIALAISRQGPSTYLVPREPPSSLISLANLVPLFIQMGVCCGIQLLALYYLSLQPWFEPVKPRGHELISCWENTTIFTVSCFQYIIIAILFSKGEPYREKIIFNLWLLISSILLTFSVIYLCLFPTKWIADLFEMIPISTNTEAVFRYTLLGLPVTYFICAGFVEYCITGRLWFEKLLSFIPCKRTPLEKYKVLLQENNIESLARTERL